MVQVPNRFMCTINQLFYLTSTADKAFLSTNISSVLTANYEKSYKQINQTGLLNLIRLVIGNLSI